MRMELAKDVSYVVTPPNDTTDSLRGTAPPAARHLIMRRYHIKFRRSPERRESRFRRMVGLLLIPALVVGAGVGSATSGASERSYPLTIVGGWNTRYEYSLTSLTTCEIGDGNIIIENDSPYAVAISDSSDLSGE